MGLGFLADGMDLSARTRSLGYVLDLYEDILARLIHPPECPLPPLSVLLENSRIRETDSFTICVQIHCPAGPSFPKHPSFHSVPRDLLDGLEASLDNSSTEIDSGS